MKKLLGIIFFFMFSFFCSVNAQADDGVLYISENDIMRAVEKAFDEEDFAEKVQIEIFGGSTSFAVQDASSYKILVSKLKLDELNNRFSCGIEVFADGKFVNKTDLQGKYYLISEAYVPAKNIQKGEILTMDNLKVIPVRANKVKADYIVEKEKIIDMEAKKPLREGKFITIRDIGKVNLIKKGDKVNMLYKSGGIQIIVKGEAVSEGAKGDKIELINTKSKKSVWGVVIDPDTVEVEVQ